MYSKQVCIKYAEESKVERNTVLTLRIWAYPAWESPGGKGMSIKMRKEEFYFDSRDNRTKIHAVRWTPDSENLVGIVQIIHGMAEYVERYEEFAEFLTARGYVVVGEDHLGHGKSVPPGGIQGYFCRQDPATVVVRDSHRLKKLTQEMYPGVPYFILGHSMGSFILRNYLCRYGKGIQGAVIMGTGMQPGGLLLVSRCLAFLQKVFLGEKHPAAMMDRLAFGGYNKRIAGARTDKDWLTKDEKIVDAYIKDPDCGFLFTVNGFGTIFQLISRIRKPENLACIPSKLPLFMVSGEEDPVGDYGKGVRLAYDSLMQAGLKDVALKLYPGDRHELLNETDRRQVMEDIHAWLQKKITVLAGE